MIGSIRAPQGLASGSAGELDTKGFKRISVDPYCIKKGTVEDKL
jgi:hypothetical protein